LFKLLCATKKNKLMPLWHNVRNWAYICLL
jgi:hypothetical protein